MELHHHTPPPQKNVVVIVEGLLTFNIGEITVDGAPLNVVFDASMADYAGVYTVVRGALNHFSGGASIGLSTLTFGIGIPEEKMLINGTMSLDGLMAEFSADAPSDFDMKNFETDPMAFPEFLAVGGGFEIDYRLGAARYDVSGSQRDDNFAARGSWADAGFKLVLNATQFLFDETATDFEITVISSEMPFPEINLSMAEYGLNLDIPLEKSDLPKDFSAGFRLVDVRVSDFLWGMFDPTGQLPRDPATIIVDVSGKANALVDILNPMEAAGFEGMPAELHEATLNNLQVTVAGVDLRGTGAFTFDNSDLESFDGLPRPQGALDLALTGANTLLDRLIAMGLVPEEQAMGGRMMMGLFTVPGAEEDSLTSRIEVNEQGHVLANGQRLK